MKYFINVFNIFLLILIPTIVLKTEANNLDTFDVNKDVKYVKSVILPKKEIEEEKPVVVEEKVKEEEIVVAKPTPKKEEVVDTPVAAVPETPTPVETTTDAIKTLVGSMTAYGGDCSGCSGVTATGHNLYNSIYYSDPTYGSVRIVAGDRSLPFGTIVRANNTKLGTFLAIVLDRGGGIGIGRRHLFDLAYTTEADASSFGVDYNISFDILREGY